MERRKETKEIRETRTESESISWLIRGRGEGRLIIVIDKRGGSVLELYTVSKMLLNVRGRTVCGEFSCLSI